MMSRLVARARPWAGHLPAPVKRRARRLIARRPRARWGNLRRFEPLSDQYGADRGLPVDRWYLYRFYGAHGADIGGRVLEVRDAEFTSRFSQKAVDRIDLVDIDHRNTEATILADIGAAGSLPTASFDCVILPQTLQYVDDLDVAVGNAWASLAPGGVLLVSMPSMSRLERSLVETESWRVTPVGLRRVLARACPGGDVHVVGYGNLITATAFLLAMAAEELRPEELEHHDPEHPLVACGRVSKPGVTA